MNLIQFLRRCLQDDSGVTAIEYALLGSLIAVAILGSVTALGGEMQTMYEFIATQVQDAINGN